MTDLYQRNGGEPAPLPSIAFDERNFAYTPPYAEEDLAMLGFSLAPSQPEFDPATQRVEWQEGAWAVVDLPPAPPPPPPPPIEITAEVLFFDRMTDEEYDDLDAGVKAGETARVYRGWAAATTFTEGTAMWTLLDKHLSLVVTADRKAELLARPVQSAALAGDEALAA